MGAGGITGTMQAVSLTNNCCTGDQLSKGRRLEGRFNPFLVSIFPDARQAALFLYRRCYRYQAFTAQADSPEHQHALDLVNCTP